MFYFYSYTLSFLICLYIREYTILYGCVLIDLQNFTKVMFTDFSHIVQKKHFFFALWLDIFLLKSSKDNPQYLIYSSSLSKVYIAVRIQPTLQPILLKPTLFVG